MIVDRPPDISISTDEDTPRKIYVDGVGATIVAERVEYLDENGKLVTESLRDFTKKALKKRFASLDDFLKRWKAAERKQAIIEELEAEGLPLDPLAEEVGKDLDPFDLICHVAFDQPAAHPPRARRECPKRDVFTKYGPQARAVLEALLAKIPGRGRARPRRRQRCCRSRRFDAMGTPVQLIKAFGDARGFRAGRPRTAIRPLSGGPHKPCPFATPSNPFRTSCARTLASMAMPSASRNSAGCSSSRSSTTRIRNSN